MYAYDIRSAKAFGSIKSLNVTLDPYQPELIAFSDSPLPFIRASVPERARKGEIVRIGISLQNYTAAAVHVFHLEIKDPVGRTVRPYSGNLLAPNGSTEKLVPLALNDPLGRWTVQIVDVLSGQRLTGFFEVVD